MKTANLSLSSYVRAHIVPFAIVVLGFSLAVHFRFVQDDAFISFRYASPTFARQLFARPVEALSSEAERSRVHT